MKKVTVIGGGTGSYTLLKGLKNYDLDIAGIVATSDSGGSSGKLRDEFGILPPGDIRKCLIALSDKGRVWRDLFEYRFEGENEKNNLGNLIMTALNKIHGDLPSAIKYASEILDVKGNVLPVTLDNVHLCAELEDGQIITGETNIDIPKHNPALKIKKVYLQPNAFAYKMAVERIINSDFVVIGPGDLYTSIIPNLIVNGISEAIQKTNAKLIYVCNVMTKHGETNNFKASDFLKEVENYLGKKVDYVILNSQMPSEDVSKKYAGENSYFVELDLDGERVIKSNLIGKDISLFRHDSNKLAKEIMEII